MFDMVTFLTCLFRQTDARFHRQILVVYLYFPRLFQLVLYLYFQHKQVRNREKTASTVSRALDTPVNEGGSKVRTVLVERLLN